MTWMNEHQIIEATAQLNAGDDVDPVTAAASRSLFNLMKVTNANSDGWAYWAKPGRAAANLQELVYLAATFARFGSIPWKEGPYTAPTAADVRKAYRPIKAFLTRSGLECELVEPTAEGIEAVVRSGWSSDPQPREIGNTYVSSEDRFIVSLVVGYSDTRDGVATPEEAAAAALKLTRDEGSNGTNWYVFDRLTGNLHFLEQDQFEEVEVY